jgi:hypothetical protein
MSSENFREYTTNHKHPHFTNNMPDNNTATVKFNVGGRAFEVSRSLLDKYSDTVLGRMVSETWHEDAEKPVFIDRNGDLFSQVLDFMRYGSIELSSATPKSMFDRELDFYGITAEEGSVQHQSLAKVTEEFSCWKSKCDMFRLALECYHQYGLRSGEVQVRICKDHALFSTDHITEEEREMLCLYLDVYFGLVMPAENSDTFNRNWFYVCRKE